MDRECIQAECVSDVGMWFFIYLVLCICVKGVDLTGLLGKKTGGLGDGSPPVGSGRGSGGLSPPEA